MMVSEARKKVLEVVGKGYVDDLGNAIYTGKAVEVVPSEIGMTFDELDFVLGIMEEKGEVEVNYHTYAGLSIYMVTLTEHGLKVHQTIFPITFKINYRSIWKSK